MLIGFGKLEHLFIYSSLKTPESTILKWIDRLFTKTHWPNFIVLPDFVDILYVFSLSSKKQEGL